MKNAFSLIELIFVILILGLMGMVAIPKLSATRDDAKTSRLAHNIMTMAFEVSTYAISKGQIDSDFLNMSNTAQVMTGNGTATLGSYKADFPYGATSPCMTLEVVNPTSDTAQLSITASSTGDSLCIQAQSLIDTGVFPMKLKGTSVSY